MLLTDTYYPIQPLVEVSSPRKKGVLMTIEGPFGQTESVNKNDRAYTNKLWKKVLSDPEVTERLNARALYGEADHPQTLYPAITRIACVTTKLWLDEKKNEIYGRTEVLDTPGGRIIKTLYEAGCRLGMSSRGAGGVKEVEGKQIVDEDGYKFGGFDFVVEPSNPNAFPTPTNESVRSKVGNILSESIDEVAKDKDFYDNLLKKIAPDGGVKLEWHGSELVVVYEGKSLDKKKPISKGVERVPALDSQPTTSSECKVVTNQKEEFLSRQLSKLTEAYKKLRAKYDSVLGKTEVVQTPVIPPLMGDVKPPIQNPPVGEEKAKETPDEDVDGIKAQLDHANQESDALRQTVRVAEANISQLKARITFLESSLTAEDSPKVKELQSQLTKLTEELTSLQNEAKKKDSVLVEKDIELKESVEKISKLEEESSVIHDSFSALQKENLLLYVKYRASECGLDVDTIVSNLPEGYRTSDIEKVISLLMNGKKRASDEGLPDFSSSTKVVVETVEDKKREDKNSPKKRVAKMISQI